jgi:hypothetical protein
LPTPSGSAALRHYRLWVGRVKNPERRPTDFFHQWLKAR